MVAHCYKFQMLKKKFDSTVPNLVLDISIKCRARKLELSGPCKADEHFAHRLAIGFSLANLSIYVHKQKVLNR